MKWVSGLLIFCCAVVAVCVLFLVRSGVSLHSAPYIRPSVISADFQNVPMGVFLRLFPDLQKSHYLIWGLSFEKPEEKLFFDGLKQRYEAEFKTSVQLISNPEQVDAEIIANCTQPCWILLPENKAHELEKNLWLEKNIHPLNREYITLTWVDFQKNQQVSDTCLQMKLLNFQCMREVAVQESERKFKDPQSRYFFMRKYQDHDYFLFVEQKQSL